MVVRDTVVNIIDRLLAHAIKEEVSDIHIEPMREYVRVRMRKDGQLYDVEKISSGYADQLAARFQVLGHMTTTQKRTAQDGKFVFHYNGIDIDIRVSSFPSVYGQKIVVRILDSRLHQISLNLLGLELNMLDAFKRMIEHTSGLILVTGPTGSGKTTTLYAALAQLNSPKRNIVTLEEPVEYSLEGITQSAINTEIGFSFAHGIRSLLRQDPDIIMVGEIRDEETANAAIEAAMTGHLVLSTVHTIDAPSTIMRLIDMGIEPYLINATLLGVIAQRLLKKVCQKCATELSLTQEQCAMIPNNSDIQSIKQGSGCEACQFSGYKGRIGVFELLEMNEQLRCLMKNNLSINEIKKNAQLHGWQSLLIDAHKKLKHGFIGLPEYLFAHTSLLK
jgi:type IV pilus assembly protein PilB